MAPETRSKAKGASLRNGKSKPEDTKKRKAPEEQAVARPKKLKQVKAVEKETPLPATESAPPAEKPSKKAKKGKKAKKAAVVEEPEAEEEVPEPSPEESEDVAGSGDDGAEDDDAEEIEDDEKVEELAAELDSEGEDEDEAANNVIAQFKEGQDVGKIPAVSKKAKKATTSGGDRKPGVVYVGRVPHGFYEHEMRQYFAQFGEITRLRLSRNKKTGASKHFAFIEFAEDHTAAVVAKTMDSYLLFGHILKCKVVPPERVHKDLWKGANRRFNQVPWSKMAGNELARPVSQSGWERRVKKENRRRSAKAQKLKEMGYEFEAPKIKAIPPPAPVEVAVEEKEIEAAVEEPAAAVEEANETKALPEPVAEAEVVAEEPVKAPKVKKSKAKKAKSKA